jgi:cobyrinic acid a,c-diamide synthase
MRPGFLAGAVGGLGADLVLCEGVMGLFDGAGAAGDIGSTADLAQITGWPVVLVVDARGQSASAAALLRGFATHRPGVTLAGVIFNRVAGARHAAMLRAATAKALPDLKVLGAVPRDDTLALPSRHLGLVLAEEHAALDDFLDRAADAMAAAIDLDALAGLARPSPLSASAAENGIAPLGQHIAVARDQAFAFAYPHLLEAWRRAGAALSFFSPLADAAPDTAADASCMPAGLPHRRASSAGCARRPGRASGSMANAAAIWCWARR